MDYILAAGLYALSPILHVYVLCAALYALHSAELYALYAMSYIR